MQITQNADTSAVHALKSNEAVVFEIASYVGEHTISVTLGLEFNGDIYAAEGTARRRREDSMSLEVGEKLAVGRALQALGNRLESQAMGLVKHHDDIREDHKNRRAKARKKAAEDAKRHAERMAARARKKAAEDAEAVEEHQNDATEAPVANEATVA